MSEQTANHPDHHVLIDFGLGKLAPSETSWIEEHLGECQDCCDTLQNLQDDTFAGMVRSLPEPQDDTEPGQVAAAAADTEPGGEEDSTPDEDAVTDGAVPSGNLSDAATLVGPTGASIESSDIPPELQFHSRYRIVEQIGKGGMGDVYRAEHKLMNRPVALKLINAQLINHPQAVERFRREVQAAAQLTHPNIVTAFDAEQAGNVHFLVMEFVDGTDLSSVVEQRGPLSVHEACRCIRQAALGLQHAHELGMVHRDIKPHNLMLSPGGHIRILDFGLASFATESAMLEADAAVNANGDTVPLHLTTFGSVMGTPDYIAPEQARDAHTADIRADIYSLGCTLCFLLNGKPPFEADTVVDKLIAHVEHAPPALDEMRDDVPQKLAAVVARMMAKDPADRYQTPAEVAEALEPFLTDVAASRTPAARSSRSASSLTRWLIGTIAAAAAVLILLGAVITVATARGRVVVQTMAGDVKVVVKQGGEQIAIIDTKTGSQVAWVPMGDVELELVGNDNAVKLDKSSFEMTRLDTVIVTVSLDAARLTQIHSFKPTDETITQDGVERAEGGWKITADGTRTVRLFETAMPDLKPGAYFYRAKLKSKEVKGQAYLEMWSRFPGRGEFFSKGFDHAIKGTNGWAEYEVPFYLQAGAQPDLVKLNVVIEGGGTVWIKDVEVRGRPLVPEDKNKTQTKKRPVEVSPHDRLQGRWIAVSGHSRNKPLTAEQLAQLAITFDGHRVEVFHPDLEGKPMAGTFEIDAKRTPMSIDLIAPDAKETLPGIFAFDGDRLKLAANDEDYARPGDFSPSDVADHLTATFERAPVAGGRIGPEERKVLTTAEEYLTALDDGQFGTAYNLLAGFANRSTTRGDYSRSMQTLRDTFGKATQRTLHRVQLISEFPNLPPGRYAGVEYKSNFEQKDGLWESLLLSVEPDGSWRVNTYASTLAPLPFPEEDPEREAKKEAAMAAARDWLKLVDAGKYGEAWEACAEYARNADDKETLVKGYTELFKPLGELKTRELKGSSHTTEMPRAPQGDYVVIQFDTQFEKGRVQETVVLLKEQDETWRVSGYFHAPLEATPEAQPDSALIKRLQPTDQLGTTEGVTSEEGGWKIESDGAREVILLKISNPGFVNRFLVAPLQFKCAGLTADVRLQMRIVGSEQFPPSVPSSAPLDNNAEWTNLSLVTTIPRDRQPTKIQVLLDFKGKGTVWVRNVSLRHEATQRPPRKVPTTPPATVPTGVNLITDPSLENTAIGERYPQDWGTGNVIPPNAYKHAVAEGGRTGKRGWMIEGDGQYAVIPTNRPTASRAYRYAAGAWVNVESGSAQIKLLYFTPVGQYLGENRSTLTISRGGWHRLQMLDDLENFPTAGRLSLALTLVGTGKAVFDDLELTAFDADELPEDFEKKYGNQSKHDPALFDRWVGRWETTTEFRTTAATPAKKYQGQAVVRKILDDRVLLWQFTGAESNGQYMALLAFDEAVGGYHIWLFGSEGEAYERTGNWNPETALLTLDVKPPAPGITGVSTDRFIDNEHIESTLLVRNADGEVSRDVRAQWVRKSSTVSVDLDVSSGPVSGSPELELLYKMAGDWKIEFTQKPSVPEPKGKTEALTENVAWCIGIGGRFLLFRAYDAEKKMTSLSLMTWEPKEKSYRFWYFDGETAGGQWRITWDASSRGFHWRAIDMPAGWIGTGFNRWVDLDTFDNQALIKDEQGRIMLDARMKKTRIK